MWLVFVNATGVIVQVCRRPLWSLGHGLCNPTLAKVAQKIKVSCTNLGQSGLKGFLIFPGRTNISWNDQGFRNHFLTLVGEPSAGFDRFWTEISLEGAPVLGRLPRSPWAERVKILGQYWYIGHSSISQVMVNFLGHCQFFGSRSFFRSVSFFRVNVIFLGPRLSLGGKCQFFSG